MDELIDWLDRHNPALATGIREVCKRYKKEWAKAEKCATYVGFRSQEKGEELDHYVRQLWRHIDGKYVKSGESERVLPETAFKNMDPPAAPSDSYSDGGTW